MGNGLPFFHEDRLQGHGTEAINPAVNIMITTGQHDVFYFGTGLDGLGGTLHRQVFDQHHGITILQYIAVGILYNQRIKRFGCTWRFSKFFRVPLMATLGAHHGSACWVSVYRLAVGAMIGVRHGFRICAKLLKLTHHWSQEAHTTLVKDANAGGSSVSGKLLATECVPY